MWSGAWSGAWLGAWPGAECNFETFAAPIQVEGRFNLVEWEYVGDERTRVEVAGAQPVEDLVLLGVTTRVAACEGLFALEQEVEVQRRRCARMREQHAAAARSERLESAAECSVPSHGVEDRVGPICRAESDQGGTEVIGGDGLEIEPDGLLSSIRAGVDQDDARTGCGHAQDEPVELSHAPGPEDDRDRVVQRG